MNDLEERLLSGIRMAMTEKHISLTAVSKEIGVPYRSLQNYLSGTSRMPAVVYVQICEYLEVDNQYVLDQSFEFSHNAFWDALWTVFGDGLLSVELKENTTGYRNQSDHNRKQAIASELTVKLNTAYDKHRKEYMKSAFAGRFPTSSERLANRLANKPSDD